MVAPLIAGAAISAAGSLAGGLMGMFGAKSAAKKQAKMAKSAIQMRVKDANKAGIHPLYALGANVSTPAPINVGAPLGEALSDMGQNVGRAMAATASNETRSGAIAKLTIENMGLQNDLLRSQIAKLNSAQLGPGMPGTSVPVIPETPSSGRPFLSLGGSRIATDPSTSSMRDWEDRYGEEGLAAWLMPLIVGGADVKENVWQSLSPRVRALLSRADTFVRKYGPMRNF